MNLSTLFGLIACGALAGCAHVREVIEDVQPTPADGAVVYAREFCQQTDADRAELAKIMNEALAPDALAVSCEPR